MKETVSRHYPLNSGVSATPAAAGGQISLTIGRYRLESLPLSWFMYEKILDVIDAMYLPNKHHFGGFSSTDGTVDFYLRINSLKNLKSIYLDYGAGRAAWFEDDHNDVRRSLRSMKGKFAEVIAADVDPVVMENNSADRCLMIEDNRIDLPTASIDVIVADYVIEHIMDPQSFAAEINRLLKPGGWFCARTPHKWHYVALAERMMPSKLGSKLLHFAQPKRKEADVFDKTYKMNTLADIGTAFTGWKDCSFCRRADPAYYFGSRTLYVIADFVHRLMPAAFSGNLFVFLQKPCQSQARSQPAARDR